STLSLRLWNAYVRKLKLFAHSPSRISLPRKGCRVGLHMGLSRCWVRSSRLQVNVTSSSDARSGAPCVEGLGAEPTLRCRPDEMATDVESVTLGGSSPFFVLLQQFWPAQT